MSISLNPIFPVIAAQGVAPDLVLQPGTVIDAQVLKLLSDNLVRIAISSLSIDVLSEIPLQAGQTLQLAVSQAEGGIRLAVVGQGASASPSSDTVTLAPAALAEAAANPSLSAAPPKNILTPLERLTVSAAAQTAATQQESLAPLFANLDAVAATRALPPKLQQAVLQVLAQQTSLDQNLTGGDVKNAFQKSGLFLEAALASGSALPGAVAPDLKAALIVLRQTLLSSLGTAAPVTSPTLPVTDAVPPQHAAPALAPSLSLSSGFDAPEILLPQVRVPVADDILELGGGPRVATVGVALRLLQETQQETGNTSLAAAAFKGGRNDDVTFHTNTPPPPFRGALPSAQPVAVPSIASEAPVTTTARHLLADTDAAIARQTLLQVASLPDRADVAGPRNDPVTPRWNFEIPFVTPQGTAMAQFEISRDGGGQETEAAKRVWRARFSLDVEPAGPVHALVSLTGEKTSVRIWVERPATAAQLRAGAAQLSQALTKAELVPGDIVIRDGAPPQPVPARAGHFLDRAL
jgi:hypothetical protein